MNNPPAFPGKQKALLIKSEHSDIAKEYEIDQNGMTLRDYFAAKAMQGLLSDPDWRQDMDFEETAYAAYKQADAMLKAGEA
jgi:galactose-1-phosphate uridylyltransferase